MFENAIYQDLIDKINKIRSYGINRMLTIPQIAILGDQSSGKSSVLEAITKLTFPRNIETCTRFATQVNLRRSEQTEMSAHIEGEPEFNECHKILDTTSDIHIIISEAKDILCSSVQISKKVLEITISGPTLSPLTIIDLPGYINTTIDGQDKGIVKTIRAINKLYIKDSRTIILAVVPANVDLNNIFVLGEAERYDPCNERTIPIVTKPDTVEPDLLPNLIHTLLNKRKSMKLGYLVMKNSGFKDINKSWDEARQREDDFFNASELWRQVPDTRKGRVSVEKFLGELLYTHIKKEFPFLRKEILELTTDYEKEIISMGPEVSSLAAARAKYFECILNLKSSLTALLEGNYSHEYISKHKPATKKQHSAVTRAGNSDGDDDNSDGDDDNSDGDDDNNRYILTTDKISELVLRYRGSELPGFISFTTFTQIYIETLTSWRTRTDEHISNMHLFYTLQTTKMDDAIENIFNDEGTPFTMNKYYYDNILKSRHQKAEQHCRKLLSKFQSKTAAGAAVPVKLEVSDVNYNEEHAIEDLQEMLLSYCKVARKRIVDVVLLQTIERHMFKQIKLYFDMLIAVDDDVISSRLLESPTQRARRQELHDKVSILKKSLRLL
ncbi:MAG: P-loop containing nucleoside triphosphate hydrolase protein [Podila humilis]|nr:MAG: P-loop containing nucleoside triphosphate hydrolase protein [Podila humilis]